MPEITERHPVEMTRQGNRRWQNLNTNVDQGSDCNQRILFFKKKQTQYQIQGILYYQEI